MIFLHEVHEVADGRMEDLEEAVRRGWKPLIERDRTAKLLWFWRHTHGTGPSYQAVSITAVKDWTAWGELAARIAGDGDLAGWYRDVCAVRREVTAKILIPAPWSPLRDVELQTTDETQSTEPTLYLHDTGWPFPGHLTDYVAALGSVFYPATRQSRMISVEACWVVAAGTGRFHEVVLLQKILDWPRFSHLLTHGEGASRAGEWMTEGLKHRDRWESKLLRTVAWSPRA
jgi:hypothetical protein